MPSGEWSGGADVPTYGVIGLGQLGAAVAAELAKKGADVIAIDSDPGRVEAIKDQVGHAIALDATEEKALIAAGVGDCETVVLALGEGQLEEAVLTTMALREIGVGRIISRASSPTQARALERLGVSKVIFPERSVGEQLARQILLPSLRDIVPLGPDQVVAEVDVPEPQLGRTLAEADLRRRWALNVIAIRRREAHVEDDGSVVYEDVVDAVPGPDTRLKAGDSLVVVGRDEAIRAFSEGRGR